MAKRWRCTGVAGTVAPVVYTTIFPANPKRLWVYLECDLATGEAMYVRWFEGERTGMVAGSAVLQAGDSILFSRADGMMWFGQIALQGYTGTAGYRGGEVYEE